MKMRLTMAGRGRSLVWAVAGLTIVLILASVAETFSPWTLDAGIVPLVTSVAAALAAFAALAERREARSFGDKVSDELDALSGRLLGLETRLATLAAPGSGARETLTDISGDVHALSQVVQGLAEALSAQDGAIGRLRSGLERGRPSGAVRIDQARDDEPLRREAGAMVPSFFPGAPFGPGVKAAPALPSAEEARREAHEARLVAAIDPARIDLHVQPVVSLPERRVRMYEVYAVLRLSDEDVLVPDEFIPTLERLGHVARLDRIVIDKALAFASRLSAQGNGVPISCNVAASSLEDGSFLAALNDRLAASPQEMKRLTVEIPERAWSEFGAAAGAVAALGAGGIGFSVDRIGGLEIDPAALARRGARYVKIRASQLLERGRELQASRLAALLARHSIQLVAEQVEREDVVPELIELGVPLAQGFAFAFPSPVETILAGRVSTGQSRRLPAAAELRDAPPRAPADGTESLRSFLRRAG